jgi:outer membrane protein TolC
LEDEMKKSAVIALVVVALSGTAWTQTAAGTGGKELSLEDCVLSALQNNLNLKAEVLAPESAAYAVRRANEIFFPQMTAGLNQSKQNSASYSFIDAADTIITDNTGYDASVSQLLPTGGQLDLTLRSYGQESNRNFLTINPVYGSTLTLSFSHPLLRNFGFKATRRQIIVAEHGREISEAQFKQTLIDTVYNVEEAYWNLVYSRENLKVGQDALELARDLLVKSQKELEVGMIPEIELLSSKAEVARREADIIQAEAAVKNAEDTLRRLVNMPGEKGVPGPSLIPTDKPTAESFSMGLEEALGLALMNRPDLENYRIQIRSRNLDVSYAKNQLLPSLNVEGQYWSPGISGTQILYLDDNPLTGVITGTIPGGASMALKDAFNFKYQNWYVGLTFDLPLTSLVSRGQYIQAKLEAERAVLRLEDQEQEVALELQTQLRACETNFQRIKAYRIARELAEESLKAEEKKLMAGLSTNYTVLQYQRDLATAKSNELRALIDYSLSLAGISRATGTTLRDRDVSIVGR